MGIFQNGQDFGASTKFTNMQGKVVGTVAIPKPSTTFKYTYTATASGVAIKVSYISAANSGVPSRITPAVLGFSGSPAPAPVADAPMEDIDTMTSIIEDSFLENFKDELQPTTEDTIEVSATVENVQDEPIIVTAPIEEAAILDDITPTHVIGTESYPIQQEVEHDSTVLCAQLIYDLDKKKYQ